MKKLLALSLLIIVIVISSISLCADSGTGGNRATFTDYSYAEGYRQDTQKEANALTFLLTLGSISDGSINKSDASKVAVGATISAFTNEFDTTQVCNGFDYHPTDSDTNNNVPILNTGLPIATIDKSDSSNGVFYTSMNAYQRLNNGSLPSFTIVFQEYTNVESSNLGDSGLHADISTADVHLKTGTEVELDAHYEYNSKGEIVIIIDSNGEELTDNAFYQIVGFKQDGYDVDFRELGDSEKISLMKQIQTPGDKPPEDNPYGAVKYNMSSSTQSFADMSLDASASIWNSEHVYDVEVAIPTSENTSSSCSAKSVLYNIQARTRTYTASTTQDIPITATVEFWYKTKNASGDYKYHSGTVSDSDKFSGSYTRTVCDVPVSSIYPLTGGSACAKQGQFVIGSVSLPGSGINAVGPHSTNVKENKQRMEKSYSLSGSVDSNGNTNYTSYSSAQSAAMSKLSSLISNKKSELNNILTGYANVIGKECNYHWQGLNVSASSVNGSPSPNPPTISGSAGPTPIPGDYPNGLYVGEGSCNYTGYGSVGMVPNNVIVHTPVVNDLKIKDIVSEPFINQKINKDNNVRYLQLDKKFTVTIPNSGVHIGADGYSPNAKVTLYNTKAGVATPKLTTNWGKIKDFRFDVDMYVLYNITKNNYKTYLLKAETWMSEDKNLPTELKNSLSNDSQTFLIPVWTPEGNHYVRTRVIAENIQSDDPAAIETVIEDGANIHVDKYVATRDVQVEVIGKIYDLQVVGSTDVDWANKVQSSKYNKNYVLSNEFPFGNTYRNNKIRSQNANASYAYAPKLGYSFTFTFKTKGRKSNQIDINVEKFQFLSKTGQTEDVDLYYKPKNSSKYVAINPGTGELKLTPNNPSLKVLPSEYDAADKTYPIEKNVEQYKKWIPSNVPYNYAIPISIGTFRNMKLPHTLRFPYDNYKEYVDKKGIYKKSKSEIISDAELPDEAGNNRILGSVGIWYAQYTLPSSTVAVPKNVDPNTHPEAIKKTGYIMVIFNIKSQEKDGNPEDYLKYIGPENRYSVLDSELPEETEIGDIKIPEDVEDERDWDKPTITTYVGNIPGPVTINPKVIAIFESDWTSNVDSQTALTY